MCDPEYSSWLLPPSLLLTCVPGGGHDARDGLRPGHQRVGGEEVRGGLQGGMGLQRVLQVSSFNQRHQLVLCKVGKRNTTSQSGLYRAPFYQHSLVKMYMCELEIP